MKKQGHILIVDDDEDVLFTAQTILKREYERITTANSPIRIESLLKKEQIDVVILDMNFKAGVTSGNEGLFWLRKIKEIDPEIHVLMNTAYGDIQLAVESMKLGASDFLVKPWEREKLVSTVNTVFQLHQSEKKVQRLKGRASSLNQEIESDFGELVIASPQMKRVRDMISQVAETDASVLILGENGTGKEVVARAIHRLSHRRGEAMIKVDLGSLSENLFESEIFGHVKGAFTDAKEDRQGRFEIADGGTLFLDEIGNISVFMQTKLLSVLQNRRVIRVGSSREIPFDVRIISATNRPLYEMVSTGDFRQDLLYRINTVEIEVPPLRERLEDIEPLSHHFLRQYAERYQKPNLRLGKQVVNALKSYDWPGNIRELQHAVERAVILAKDSTVTNEDFLLSKRSQSVHRGSLKVEDVEREAIVKAIDKHQGNLSESAKELGMGRTTLYRKMKKYGILSGSN